jgi:hypothetical protein
MNFVNHNKPLKKNLKKKPKLVKVFLTRAMSRELVGSEDYLALRVQNEREPFALPFPLAVAVLHNRNLCGAESSDNSGFAG